MPMGSRLGAQLKKADLLSCSTLLKRAKLVMGDFAATVEQVEADDFVYLDPPYAVTSRRIFREYGKKTFDTTDITRLSRSLELIVTRKADFLVSYADCSEARSLAKCWYSLRVPVKRHIAGFTGDRRRAYEWLISNCSMPLAVRPSATG